MENGDRRTLRCLFGYLGFVGLLLVSVIGLWALFHYLSQGAPTWTAIARPVSAETRDYVVVLDAGHGGEDGGTVGLLDGKTIEEKHLNLAVAELVRDLLVADGIAVVMTREKDVLLYDRNVDYEGRKKVLDLAARVAVAESTENAMFVSIHMNAFPQAQYKGLQVYYSPNNTVSETLAETIQRKIATSLQPDNHRKIKRAGSEIHLLEQLDCPAVLVECGFLSNAEDCRALTDPAYRQRLAFLLFCAIRETVALSDT
jgi:N-acetylmuramoyl-L-alanine amidase